MWSLLIAVVSACLAAAALWAIHCLLARPFGMGIAAVATLSLPVSAAVLTAESLSLVGLYSPAWVVGVAWVLAGSLVVVTTLLHAGATRSGVPVTPWTPFAGAGRSGWPRRE